jgi:choline dehydrogenase
MTTTQRFDYIVVGGGTAGCVIAARLSQDPGCRVLLLEAGGASGPALMSDPAAWLRLWGTSVDWAYRTVPQATTDGAVHGWPRGKVLGGSSAINGMMHIRGDRSSYDAWEAAGAAGWNYDSLLPFLKRSERAPGRDPVYRGLGGPMLVGPGAGREPIWEALLKAAVEAGHPPIDDPNGATAEGVGWGEFNVVDGRRQSAADGYLTPAAGRPNLTIRADATARRLMIEHGRCRGVVYTVSEGGVRAVADREVILAAGVIGTPQLLMLSGVGAGEHLRGLGIETIADLPGVGANLHDHPKAIVTYAASQAVRARVFARKPLVLTRTDPSETPDMQMIFLDMPIHPRFAPGHEHGYTVIFSLMTPVSRGSVRLASADPRQPPLIDPNYLANDRDVERMVAGLRAAREIGAADALAPVGASELFPGPDAHTDAALRTYLRGSVSTYFHPVGTCRIGSDRMSVLDPELRVHGIANLRVADASVMPSVTSGNTNAAVLGIAERASSIITGERVQTAADVAVVG